MIQVESLAQCAFQITKGRMERHGNTLNEEHQGGLKAVAREMAENAIESRAGNKDNRRTAFSLATGMGKTTSVIGFIAAVHRMELDLSIAVCAEQVDALCDLQMGLMNAGVPADKIGLSHSYKHNPDWPTDRPLPPQHARLPRTPDGELRNKQFLLLTHNRAKGPALMRLCHDYKPIGRAADRSRDLVIWDESLLVSEGHCVVVEQLKGEIGKYKAICQQRAKECKSADSRCEALMAYFHRLVDTIDAELEKENPGVFALPHPGAQMLGMEQALSVIYGKGAVPAVLKCALKFAEIGTCSAGTWGKAAIVRHELVVPRELSRMVILDASYPIRRLEQLDTSITWKPENDLIPSYQDVTFRHWHARAGRTALEQEFNSPTPPLAEEVADIVLSILRNTGSEEAVLILTHKKQDGAKAPDMLKRIKTTLGRAHINLDAKIIIDAKRGTTAPLINFLTWGQERATNRFAHCKHVILAGLMTLPTQVMAAKIAGQRQDDSAPVTADTIREVQVGEHAHSIYQAVSRGNSRTTQNFRAGKMDVYLFHHALGPIQQELRKRMPDARWTLRVPAHMNGKLNRTEKAAVAVAGILSQCSENEISFKAVRKEIKATPDVWKAAAKLAPAYTGLAWAIGDSGRMFIRLTERQATFGGPHVARGLAAV